MKRIRHVAVIALAVCGVSFSVAACGGSSHSVTNVATSATDTTAENSVNTLLTSCIESVSTFKLLTSSGRKQVVTCLESKVPPAKRAAFEKCVLDAAISDKVWSKSGRVKFVSADGAACLNTATK